MWLYEVLKVLSYKDPVLLGTGFLYKITNITFLMILIDIFIGNDIIYVMAP